MTFRDTEMQSDDIVEEVSDLLKALSHKHRFLIICRLSKGEKSVGQLADSLGIRNSTVSQHLALLRRDKIIRGRRDGHMIWYSLNNKIAREVVSAISRNYGRKVL